MPSRSGRLPASLCAAVLLACADRSKPAAMGRDAVSRCTEVTTPCVSVDFSQAGHTISPLLFGDGIEWQHRGLDVLAPDATGRTPGTFRSEVVSALSSFGFTLMRYPGGTLADLFHWKQAVGPLAIRAGQRTFDIDTRTGQLVTELPVFGPDEFADLAARLGTEILLTVNVGTGTAQEAAEWVSYWRRRGVTVRWVEIGNEVYIQGPGDPAVSFPAMGPAVYAQKFDEYARALRAVDPSLKLGAIGMLDTSSWCYPNCASPPPWNQLVLQGIKEKIDFFAVHDAYAPGTGDHSQPTYEAMLASPTFMARANMFIEKDIDTFANPQSRGIPLAITEHAPYFVAPPGGNRRNTLAALQSNQTLAGALYQALSFNAWLSDPRVHVANHINPLNSVFQAPLQMALPGDGYPDRYDPKPVVSAYGHVFRAYRELAGQTWVGTTVSRSPTMDTRAVPFVPAQKNISLLDVAAARGTVVGAAAKGWLLIVNRSLTTDLRVSFVLDHLPSDASALVIDLLTASEYTARNIPGEVPTVDWGSGSIDKLSGNSASFGTTLTIPKHTLVRVRVR